MAVTPAASDSLAASSAYSSTLPPAIDTTARAPRDSSHGRSRCRKASIPGPCRPIELSIPLGVSAIRGVGRPARGASITDLVTTAPILATSKNWASSRPAPAHPDAVRIGLGSSTWPSLVRRSTPMPLPPGAALGPACGRLGRARLRAAPAACGRGFQPGAPSASNGIVPMSSQRTVSPRNTGPATQDRTMRVTPSSPTTGSTQVMHTPMPHAMDSSTSASTGMSYRPASVVTWRSMPIGPQA